MAQRAGEELLSLGRPHGAGGLLGEPSPTRPRTWPACAMPLAWNTCFESRPEDKPAPGLLLVTFSPALSRRGPAAS